LRNTDTAQLLGALETIVNGPPEKQFEFVSKIKAALYLYPDYFKNIKHLLENSDVTDKKYQIIFSAILAAESIPSQQYLAQFLKDHSTDYGILRSVLPQIGIMTYVIDSSLMRSLSLLISSRDKDISSLAGLAISNLSKQYKFTDSVRHRVTNAILFAHYNSSSKNNQALLDYLKQIGNSGDESKTDFLVPYLDDPDEEVRIQAIAACRFILNQRMDSILSKWMLEKQKDSSMCQNLFNVIQLRFPEKIIRTAIYKFLEGQQNVNWPVKEQYVDYLRTYADEIPSLAKEISGLNIPDPKIKESVDALADTKTWFH